MTYDKAYPLLWLYDKLSTSQIIEMYNFFSSLPGMILIISRKCNYFLRQSFPSNFIISSRFHNWSYKLITISRTRNSTKAGKFGPWQREFFWLFECIIYNYLLEMTSMPSGLCTIDIHMYCNPNSWQKKLLVASLNTKYAFFCRVFEYQIVSFHTKLIGT